MKYLMISDMHFPKFKNAKQKWKFNHRMKRMINSKGYLNYLNKFMLNGIILK